jgi:aromatic-L-amino-acid decarboxylase
MDEEMLRQAACWEVVTPAQLGIVTFRYIPAGASSGVIDTINQQLVEAMIADGFTMISSTVLRGHIILRLCTINPRTTESDLRETIQRLEQFGNKLYSHQ